MTKDNTRDVDLDEESQGAENLPDMDRAEKIAYYARTYSPKGFNNMVHRLEPTAEDFYRAIAHVDDGSGLRSEERSRVIDFLSTAARVASNREHAAAMETLSQRIGAVTIVGWILAAAGVFVGIVQLTAMQQG